MLFDGLFSHLAKNPELLACSMFSILIFCCFVPVLKFGSDGDRGIAALPCCIIAGFALCLCACASRRSSLRVLASCQHPNPFGSGGSAQALRFNLLSDFCSEKQLRRVCDEK